MKTRKTKSQEDPGASPPSEGRCLVCGESIHPQAMVKCVRCSTPHHLDCFRYVGQCAVFGCGMDMFRRVAPVTGNRILDAGSMLLNTGSFKISRARPEPPGTQPPQKKIIYDFESLLEGASRHLVVLGFALVGSYLMLYPGASLFLPENPLLSVTGLGLVALGLLIAFTVDEFIEFDPVSRKIYLTSHIRGFSTMRPLYDLAEFDGIGLGYHRVRRDGKNGEAIVDYKRYWLVLHRKNSQERTAVGGPVGRPGYDARDDMNRLLCRVAGAMQLAEMKLTEIPITVKYWLDCGTIARTITWLLGLTVAGGLVFENWEPSLGMALPLLGIYWVLGFMALFSHWGFVEQWSRLTQTFDSSSPQQDPALLWPNKLPFDPSLICLITVVGCVVGGLGWSAHNIALWTRSEWDFRSTPCSILVVGSDPHKDKNGPTGYDVKFAWKVGGEVYRSDLYSIDSTSGLTDESEAAFLRECQLNGRKTKCWYDTRNPRYGVLHRWRSPSCHVILLLLLILLLMIVKNILPDSLFRWSRPT